MNQLKQGDLALIVGAFGMTQNIGKECHLVQFVQTDEVFIAPNGDKCQHGDVPAWIVCGEGLCTSFEVGDIEHGNWAVCAPKHLMPLRGDFAPEQQKSREMAT